MKILVTGATGFVGSHLCEYLTHHNHQVFGLARSITKFNQFQIQATFIAGDLENSQDPSWVENLPSDLDAVIHTAGLMHTFAPKMLEKINVDGTRYLIEILQNKYQSLKFLYISSQAASGPNLLGIARLESDTESPVSRYGLSKLKAEKLIISMIKNWNPIIIRPSMILGPKDPAFVEVFKMLQNGFIPYEGNLEKQFSYVAIYDLMNVIYAALFLSNDRPEVFFAANPTPVSFKEIIRSIANALDKKYYFPIKVPRAGLKVLAYCLWAINYLTPLSPRITPDKYYELIADEWVCSHVKSTTRLEIIYDWDLTSIISKTLLDYKNRGWIT